MSDKPTSKFAVSAIDKLEQQLDQVPPYRDTVVSKRQAIVRLAPKLYAMREKGYSWAAVAAWLGEHGMAVTTAVLNGYLRRAPAPPRAPERTPPTPTPRGARALRATAAAPVRAVLDAPTTSASAQQVPAAAKAPVAVPPTRSAEHGARRSEFEVRPDSEEI